LRALEILVSTASSPYVCLVALDPHAITQSFGQTGNVATGTINVEAYTYLKNIFNISVCLPEVTKCFVTCIGYTRCSQ